MTIPLQFGWQQIILLLIAIVGVGLLISAIMGLILKVKEVEELEDLEGRRYRRWHHRRRFHWKRGSSGIVILLIAIALLWFTAAVQTYLGLTGDIKVATIRATPVTNSPQHKMFVDLTLYDQHGTKTSENSYEVGGDRWFIQGNIIEFPGWLNVLGLHAGYKVTRLFGQYNDINQQDSKAIALNGGDGDFFDAAQQKIWYTNPFVQATYINAVGKPADGKSYDIYVNQTGYHI